MNINALAGYLGPKYDNTLRAGNEKDGVSFQATLQATSTPAAYDFTSMTPNQMRPVAQELNRTGKIDPVQLFELQNAGVPFGKLGPGGQFVPLSDAERAQYANRPVNYLQAARDAISYQEQSGRAGAPTSTINEWKGILKVLQDLQG